MAQMKIDKRRSYRVPVIGPLACKNSVFPVWTRIFSVTFAIGQVIPVSALSLYVMSPLDFACRELHFDGLYVLF